jgi:DNA-binding transcriptional regulator of glucitol operon
MSLRRVVEHLKHQHWTAILIYLVIVVLGVFIGIQVSNWNAERETRQKAAVFTGRLRADLRVEAWAYECLIEYNRDILASAARALASGFPPQCHPAGPNEFDCD